MPYKDFRKRRYDQHRQNAKKVGKVFALSFEEWLGIWVASGRWHQRGTRRGQYVMARYNDRGAYIIGNVKIVTVEENSREANDTSIHPWTEIRRKNVARVLRKRNRSKSQRELISKRKIEYWKNSEHKKRLSEWSSKKKTAEWANPTLRPKLLRQLAAARKVLQRKREGIGR